MDPLGRTLAPTPLPPRTMPPSARDGLGGLPPELLLMIASCLNFNDLRKLRLTCHGLEPFAAQILFSSTTLCCYPDGRAAPPMRSILKRPRLSGYVRKIRVKMDRFRYCPCQQLLANPKGNSKFFEVFYHLRLFPATRAIELHFSLRCNHNSTQTTLPALSHFVHNVVLSTLFYTTRLMKRIESLHIEHVACCSFSEPKFQDMLNRFKCQPLSNLKDLCLHVTSGGPWTRKSLDPGPRSQLRQALADLPTVWLKPTANTLRHLTLSCERLFGYCPKLDLRKVYFPCLQTLALSNYVFSHEWQLDWLKSHSTLREIYFGHCTVLLSNSTTIAMDNDGYPTPETKDPDPDAPPLFFYYNVRWNTIFEVMTNELRNLRQFSYGYTHLGVGWESRLEPPTKWFWQDYATAHNEDLIWMAEEGYVAPNQGTASFVEYWVAQGERDENAFKKLQNVIADVDRK